MLDEEVGTAKGNSYYYKRTQGNLTVFGVGDYSAGKKVTEKGVVWGRRVDKGRERG